MVVKKQAKDSTSSTSTSATTVKSSTTTKSSSTSSTKVSSTAAVESTSSAVQISDVTGLTKSASGRSIQSIQSQPTEYIVTTPDVHSQQKGKVRYIFGGTQISEVDSMMQKDGHKRDTQSFIDQERSSSAVSVDPALIQTTEIISTAPETVILSETSSSHHASSSSMQKGSTTSYTYEIVDGVERLVDSSNREWGSNENQKSDQSFSAKFGTGITPEVKYSESISDKAVAFDSGAPGEGPMYEQKNLASTRKLEQIGDSKPIEYSKDEFEHSKYDKTKKKVLTDTAFFEDKRMLDTESILDAVPSGLQREGLAIDSGLAKQIDKTTINLSDSDLRTSALKQHANGDVSTTAVIMNDDRLDSVNSIANTSSHHETVQTSSSSKVSESQSKSMASAVTTTYTSKVWDEKTNTWKVVDETTVNEKDGIIGSPGKVDSPTGRVTSSTTTEYIKTMPEVARDAPKTTTTYISKYWDKKTNSWKVVERTVDSDSDITRRSPSKSDTPEDVIITSTTEYIETNPGAAGSVRDITKDTTTSESKNYWDKKTSTWKVIEETQIIDKDGVTRYTNVPVDEMMTTATQYSESTPGAKGPRDVAGKSTTTHISKFWDKNTNTWKVIDEKTIIGKDGKPIMPGEHPTDEYVTTTTEYIETVPGSTAGPHGTPKEITTTQISKYFDEKTNTWKILDETILRERITGPEFSGPIDSSPDKLKTTPTDYPGSGSPEKTPRSRDKPGKITNTQTSTFWDKKTNTWKVVDEKVIIGKDGTPIKPGKGDRPTDEYVSTTTTEYTELTPGSRQRPHGTTDETTTYTSEYFDEKTNTWKVVDEKTLRERKVAPGKPDPLDSSPEKPTIKYPDGKTPSTRDTPGKTRNSQTSTFWDKKTNTWKVVDEKVIIGKDGTPIKPGKGDRPTDEYVTTTTTEYTEMTPDSKSRPRGTTDETTTTYTSEYFDEKTNTWKVVDEKTLRERKIAPGKPDPVDSSPEKSTTKYPDRKTPATSVTPGKTRNSQTSTFWDKKTNTWKVVDEKVIIGKDGTPIKPGKGDRPTDEYVSTTTTEYTEMTPDSRSRPRGTTDEITTTYTSEYFDEKTNTWKVLDEKTLREKTTPGKLGPFDSAPEKPTTKYPDGKTPTTRDTPGKTRNSQTSTFWDKKTNTWKVVNEKVIAGEDGTPVKPGRGNYPTDKYVSTTTTEYIEKLPGQTETTGETTTIYSSKYFDEKTNTWKVLDESTQRERFTSPGTPGPLDSSPGKLTPHVTDYPDGSSPEKPPRSRDIPGKTINSQTGTFWDKKTNTWKVDEKTTIIRDEKDSTPRSPGKQDSPVREPISSKSDKPVEKRPEKPAAGTKPRDATKKQTTTNVTKFWDKKTSTWKFVDNTTTIDMKDGKPKGPRPSGSPLDELTIPTTTDYVENVPGSGPRPRDTPTPRDKLSKPGPRDVTSTVDQTTTSMKDITDVTTLDEKVTTKTSKIISNLDDTKKTTRRSSNTVSTIDDTKDTTIRKTTKTSENITADTSTMKKQIYDAKTKTWKEVDEKTIKSSRPSLVRYVSQESDGTFTTIYKRKVFDQKTGGWKVVDEKIIQNKNAPETIPELMDDVSNVTTTTYTTKIYDTKTGTWKIVDEKSFVDKETYVPTDIVHEIEKDHADVANITTTTEITKKHTK